MIKKILITLLILTGLVSFQASDAIAQKESFRLDQEMIIEAKPIDQRALILRDYLAQYNSPLQNHAQDFIDASDTYGLDWKLVPAISGVESTFGKAIPGGFNGWGWGVYGTHAIYFTSWRDGIFTVSKGLKEDYISRGLLDPYAMNKRYASSPYWGGHVAYFLADIEKYAKNYRPQSELTLEKKQADVNTAGSSAKLALKFVQIGGN